MATLSEVLVTAGFGIWIGIMMGIAIGMKLVKKEDSDGETE